jgi:hypothetical protein
MTLQIAPPGTVTARFDDMGVARAVMNLSLVILNAFDDRFMP